MDETVSSDAVIIVTTTKFVTPFLAIVANVQTVLIMLNVLNVSSFLYFKGSLHFVRDRIRKEKKINSKICITAKYSLFFHLFKASVFLLCVKLLFVILGFFGVLRM